MLCPFVLTPVYILYIREVKFDVYEQKIKVLPSVFSSLYMFWTSLRDVFIYKAIFVYLR